MELIYLLVPPLIDIKGLRCSGGENILLWDLDGTRQDMRQ